MGKPTRRWLKKAELYKLFDFHPQVSKDYSAEAAQAMFDYESTGQGDLSHEIFQSTGKPINGYSYGKHWMDWQISAWTESVRSMLTSKHELLSDPALSKFPRDWLEEVIQKIKMPLPDENPA